MAENHLADSEQALENALNPAPTTLEIQTKTIERMNRVQAQYDDLLKKHEELVHQLEVVQNRYDEISSSSFWKMTKPAHAVLDTIKTGKPLFREKQPKEKLTQGKNVPISFLRVLQV